MRLRVHSNWSRSYQALIIVSAMAIMKELKFPQESLALWESLQNAPISSAFSERMPQSRVSRARGVGRSSGCWLSRSSAV
jgi:hypothetical protein